MTLKEKLFNTVFDNAWEYKHKNTITELEQIADEYAIEFAEWITQQPEVKIIKKSGLGSSYMKMSSKELLETYKKEKGL